MNCESTSGIETISRLDPAFTWSLESVNLFHYMVRSPGQTAEIFSLSPTVCCKPSHLKSFKFHPLGSSFFRNYVVWCPAADSEKISFKSSIRAVGRTHPALNAQPMLKYLENPKKLLKIGLQGNGLKI